MPNAVTSRLRLIFLKPYRSPSDSMLATAYPSPRTASLTSSAITCPPRSCAAVPKKLTESKRVALDAGLELEREPVSLGAREADQAVETLRGAARGSPAH